MDFIGRIHLVGADMGSGCRSSLPAKEYGAHAKRPPHRNHPPADLARPNNRKGFAFQSVTAISRPITAALLGLQMVQISVMNQQGHEDELRQRTSVNAAGRGH